MPGRNCGYDMRAPHAWHHGAYVFVNVQGHAVHRLWDCGICSECTPPVAVTSPRMSLSSAVAQLQLKQLYSASSNCVQVRVQTRVRVRVRVRVRASMARTHTCSVAGRHLQVLIERRQAASWLAEACSMGQLSLQPGQPKGVPALKAPAVARPSRHHCQSCCNVGKQQQAKDGQSCATDQGHGPTKPHGHPALAGDSWRAGAGELSAN